MALVPPLVAVTVQDATSPVNIMLVASVALLSIACSLAYFASRSARAHQLGWWNWRCVCLAAS